MNDHMAKVPHYTMALLTIEKNFETKFWELCKNFLRTLTIFYWGTVDIRHMGVQVSRICTNLYRAECFEYLLLDLAKKT
jgi:hypothetical protein